MLVGSSGASFFALVIFHRLDDVGERFQSVRIRRELAAPAMRCKHRAVVAAVRQVEQDRGERFRLSMRAYIEATSVTTLRRPEALGNGGVARPDARIDVLRR